MKRRWNRHPLKISLATLALFGGLAYLLLQVYQPLNQASAQEAEMTAQVVETITLEYQPMRRWSQYSGRLMATAHADIRPLVAGTVQQVLFEDGEQVEEGQLLFVIDPRPYQAELQRARAELASAESAAALARIEFERADGLVSRDVVSRSIRDQRQNDLNTTLARLEAARAAVFTAELNLEYAHVRAPFAGRVGRAEVKPGNVVDAGANAPVLTRLVSTERLYAEFEVDEATYLSVMRSQRIARQLAEASPESSANGDLVPVEISIVSEGDRREIYSGELYAFDNQLDTRSGTIRARAVINNHDQTLLPGMFAEISLGTAITEPTLLVPEHAISPNQDKRFVYVVGDSGRTEYRELKLGPSINGKRIVLEGLKAGDKVITNGLHRLTNDMPVVVAQS